MRNEHSRLALTVARLRTWPGLDAGLEVVLVDDGSTDGTAALARSAAAELAPASTVVLARPPAGKGAAVRAGMGAASGAVRVFVDADLPVDLVDLDRCFAVLESGEADFVFGSRTHGGSTVAVRQPPSRRAASRLFNLFARATGLTAERDTQCGLKGASAAASACTFERTRIDGFAFDIEVLRRAATSGLRVQPVPVRWSHQPAPRRPSLGSGARAFADLVVLRLRGVRA